MNSLKSFVLALGAAIGVPTYIMAVRPYAQERERQPVAYDTVPKNPGTPPNDPEGLKTLYYPQSFSGDNKRGELVYAREGCAQCHSQIIRPDYAGVDQFKRYWGKEQTYAKDVPIAVRQTHMWDYLHEDYAMTGVRRIGPDLANAGYRYLMPNPATPAEKDQDKWVLDPKKVATLYQHLYAPRSIKDREWSNMPSYKHLFETVRRESPEGRADALQLPDNLAPQEGYEIVPTQEGKALVDYLIGLKRGWPLPYKITGVVAKSEK